MSAVGIDFGNENCYVAIAKAGGIETVTNDYSQRATPSYVAFGSTCRDLGTSAKSQHITNLKNTVSGFKRLIGKKFKDPICQHEISYLPYVLFQLPNGSLGVKVSYLGKDVVFTIHQIVAIMFTKLKDIAETALGTKVTNCVVSVPVFFTDAERRAMLDACHIAGLNVLRLVNENAAAALAYGFYRQDFSDSKPKKIVFVDIGHSSVQATACAFTRGKLKILASAWDLCLGGRDFDNSMVRHFSQEFKTKYNLDVLSNNRAIIRLLQECEKLKKQLSVNPQVLPLNIECLMDDKDVSSSLGREKFEELGSDILSRIEDVFERMMFEANLSNDDISAVELVGGTTRIPAIKNLIKKVFGIEPSTTLNLDEAVARGCAIQAAMLSPGLKVRDFAVSDLQPYPIKLSWNISKHEQGDIEVFPKNHQVPYSKLLTFFRKEDFCLNAYYCTGNKSHPDVLIGSFNIKNVNQQPSGESVKIIVKLRMNIHGIFTVSSAMIVDKDFKDNVALDQHIEDLKDLPIKLTGLEIPLNSFINEQPKSEGIFSLKRHKKLAKEIELQIEPKVLQLSESEKKTLIEREQKMLKQDLYEKERIDAKNSVEEFVYELRGQLSDELGKFIDEQELGNFMYTLDTLEHWIYEDGQSESKEMYTRKFSELKEMVQPAVNRKNEHESRSTVLEDFQQRVAEAQDILTSYLTGAELYSHIEPMEMEQVQKLVDETSRWLQSHIGIFQNLKLYEDPPISAEQLICEKDKFIKAVSSVINKTGSQTQPPVTVKKEHRENQY